MTDMTDWVPPTAEEAAILVAQFAALPNYFEQTRQDLQEALALADLYPAPTPEETALIDTQVVSALAGYRALTNPPADIVALAAAVISWRSEL